MQILLLTGGSSSERDVAIASAAQVAIALRSRGHGVTVADTTTGVLDHAGEAALFARTVGRTPPDTALLARRESEVLLGGFLNRPEVQGADVVFLGLHGGTGEDGTIQHLLGMAGLRYTGSDPVGSALALDKDLAKHLFRAAGVPTADWMMAPADPARIGRELGWPVVVKPPREGSTVGLTVVREAGGLDEAIALALRHDHAAMIERFIPGRELTVGVLGDQALAVGEIIPKGELFDYEAKYTPGMVEEIFPADLPAQVAEEVRILALAAHRALRLRHYSRVDFRLTPEGRPYCLEVNTLPGMTATSLLPQSAAAARIPFPDLCERICREAIAR